MEAASHSASARSPGREQESALHYISGANRLPLRKTSQLHCEGAADAKDQQHDAPQDGIRAECLSTAVDQRCPPEPQ